MISSRPDKLDDTQTMLYETDALRYSARRLMENKWTFKFQEWVHLECFLLHFRNLIDFFGKTKLKDDDLHITRYENHWRSTDSPVADSLQRLNDRGQEIWLQYESPGKRDKISKYLQHGTKSRTGPKTWDVSGMYHELEPLLTEFELLLPDKSRRWGAQSPIAEAEAGPTFCSSTEVVPPQARIVKL
jgi:hypothetical protein